MLTHGRSGFFALLGLAVEGLVNRLAEGVPQLLLKLAVQRDALRLLLPVLLQCFDGVNAHHRHRAQRLGLFDHGVAAFDALFLRRLQRGVSRVHRRFPLGLQLGEGFFRHMAQVLPTLGKLVQTTADALPITLVCQLSNRVCPPGGDFSHQIQALGAVDGVFGFDLLNPGFHHDVGGVASVVKRLPQGVVGQAALVGLFPLLAQGAQGFLHFAAAQGLAFWAFEQAFGLGDQLFAQLVGTPALPAFQLASGGQRCVGLVLQLVINQFAMLFQRVTQGIGCASAGFAVAFAYFLL